MFKRWGRDMNRRSILKYAAAVPVLALPVSVQGADVLSPLVAAWRRRCELAREIELASGDQDVPEWIVDELARCEDVIIEGRCRTLLDVAVKLHLLIWLRDNGSTAEWEAELLRTALSALPEVSA